MASDKHHLLICTVGGTSEPVVASLRHWEPARVLFVHSIDTKTSAEALTKEHGLLQAGAWDMVELQDAQDFNDCVRRMMRGLDEQISAWRQKGADYDVIVDFTGGTKCMSAALALVSRRWPCKFSYVGGTERTKGGTGIVVLGKEETHFTQNPWNALGYQAIEDACLLFDQHAFTSAMKLLGEARKAADDDAVKRILSTFCQLCEGYGLWDRFQHSDAKEQLTVVLKNASDIRAMLSLSRSEVVICSIRKHHQNLEQILIQPQSRAMVTDLLANAGRRRHEGRFDDGVARLYRAIDALAQVALAERHGVLNTGKVQMECITEPLRSAWNSRAENGTVRLGLQDAYTLLDAFGDPLGKTFKDLTLHDPVRSPLTARNQSILAHGFQPVSEQMFFQLWQTAMELGKFSNQDLPTFPQLASSEAI